MSSHQHSSQQVLLPASARFLPVLDNALPNSACMIATVSPQVVHDVHDGAKVLARTILNKQSEKIKMSKPEFSGGLPSPQREVSLDALAFLRRDTSLDKLDLYALNRAGSLSSFDRTGSLSLDFLKRESSLENPSSPGDIFRLGSTGFSRGCRCLSFRQSTVTLTRHRIPSCCYFIRP